MNSYKVMFVGLVLAFSDVPTLTVGCYLESMLTNISDRLGQIEKSCCAPVIIGNCSIDFAAYGDDDPVKQGYVKTSEGSYQDLTAIDDRGVTTVEINPVTCRTRNRQTFDTWGSPYRDSVQLLETLESATVGTIIVGVTADSAVSTGEFENIVGAIFTRYNMTISGLQNRDKFAFILQKGYPKKTVFERKARYLDYLSMKVQLSGESAAEAKFLRIL